MKQGLSPTKRELWPLEILYPEVYAVLDIPGIMLWYRSLKEETPCPGKNESQQGSLKVLSPKVDLKGDLVLAPAQFGEGGLAT